MHEIHNEDLFKGIILFGLNSSTYKMGLAQVLLNASKNKQDVVHWENLATNYFDEYLMRLDSNNPMPQQGNPNRLTKMERIIKDFPTTRIILSGIQASQVVDCVPSQVEIVANSSEFVKKITE